MEALKPVQMSSAMRRKMNEFTSKTQLSATTKNGSRNIHPTIKALEARGLVKTKLTNTGRPFLIAELTEQGKAWMVMAERATTAANEMIRADIERASSEAASVKFPKGTPEHDAFRSELRTSMESWLVEYAS